VPRRRRPHKPKTGAPPGATLVDNPHGEIVPATQTDRGETKYRPDQVVVVRQLRDDPLGKLWHRKQISPAQFAAGREIQSLHERAGIGNTGGVDTSAPVVDGGPTIPTGITDRHRRAVTQLIRINRVLGREGQAVVELYLIKRHTAAQIALMLFDGRSQRDVDYVGRRLRQALSDAAAAMGLETRRKIGEEVKRRKTHPSSA
tara:strand:+ start:1002 stop:1607 length:606 start_codon:yes stop_codon:yes gene_type:complete